MICMRLLVIDMMDTMVAVAMSIRVGVGSDVGSTAITVQAWGANKSRFVEPCSTTPKFTMSGQLAAGRPMLHSKGSKAWRTVPDQMHETAATAMHVS